MFTLSAEQPIILYWFIIKFVYQWLRTDSFRKVCNGMPSYAHPQETIEKCEKMYDSCQIKISQLNISSMRTHIFCKVLPPWCFPPWLQNVDLCPCNVLWLLTLRLFLYNLPWNLGWTVNWVEALYQYQCYDMHSVWLCLISHIVLSILETE